MDYLDNFGPDNADTYRGTDIKNDKCSWLIVMALQKCNPDQRTVLEVIISRNLHSTFSSFNAL